MAYTLRPARAEDVEAMMAIAHEGLRPYVEALWGWEPTDQQERYRAQFKPDSIAIICSNGRDVGYLQVEDHEDHIFVAGIYLAKDYRRRGIGREVLVDVTRKAEEAGKPLRLRVLLPNPAQHLYERLGFRVTGTTESHVYMEVQPSCSRAI